MTDRKGVLFIGALPPPVGGQANVNLHMLNRLSSEGACESVNVAANGLGRNFSYHYQRARSTIFGIFKIAARSNYLRSLYISTDAGLGLVYNILAVFFARVFKYRLILHHHSFTFIDRRMRLMNMLTLLAGRGATHIFLCSDMMRRFKQLYPHRFQALICSNAVFINPVQSKIETCKAQPIKFGLMSHLSDEKGLDDFLAIIELTKKNNLNALAILAGPPVSESDEQAILNAKVNLHDRLEYRGAVYGDAKKRFFQDIDVFVFPTKFKVEAQPLVLFEAMAYGIPIISNNRGCIKCDLEGPGVHVVSDETQFVNQAYSILHAYAGSREQLVGSSKAVTDRYISMHRAALNGFAAAIAEIIS